MLKTHLPVSSHGPCACVRCAWGTEFFAFSADKGGSDVGAFLFKRSKGVLIV